MFALISVGGLCTSCQQNCDASVVPQSCPPPITTQPDTAPHTVQLSQLNAEDRERLRKELADEIRAEIRSEMREQWFKEFEQDCIDRQVAAHAHSPEPTHATDQEEVRPVAKPAHLPPTQKIERDPGGLKILRQAFSTQIQHRMPVDEREAFTIADASVYCYVEIASSDEDERSIMIRFTHSTGLTQSYTLPVSQSPAWRTWSKLNLTKSMTGTWLCEVFNEDGTLLASKPFVIVDE